jgi:hypothetical protein
MTLESTPRDALEHADDGQSDRHEPIGGLAHVAGLRAAAASRRDVQVVEGPAVRRQGP